VGARASWLFILITGYLQVRYLSTPPWWTAPDFIAGLDEAVGLVGASLVMGLMVQHFKDRPVWPPQVIFVALLGLLVAWANARLRPSTTMVSVFLLVCAVWLTLLVRRDWRPGDRRGSQEL
jgi:multisubunit Na+/H+ antiporter MnhB subunit